MRLDAHYERDVRALRAKLELPFPEQSRRKIRWDNPARLYGFE